MGQCISETAPATVNQAAALPWCIPMDVGIPYHCNGGAPQSFQQEKCFSSDNPRSVCQREGEVSDRDRGLCRCPAGMVYDRTETKENAGFGAKCVPCEFGMHNPFGNCVCDSTGEPPRLRLGSDMHGFMKDILECPAPIVNPSPQTAFRNFHIAKASYFPSCHVAGTAPACCLSKITGYGCCRGEETKAVTTRGQIFDAPPYQGQVAYHCSCGANRVYDRDDHLTGYRSPNYAYAQCVLCPSTATFNTERLRCECPDLRNPFLLDRLQCAEPDTTSTTATPPTNSPQVGVTLTLPNTVESAILKYDQCNLPVEQQPFCCSKDGYGCCREGEENAIDFDTREEWCRCPYGSVYDRREYSTSTATGAPVRKDIAKCVPCPEGSVFDRFSKSCRCSDETDPFTLPGGVCSRSSIVLFNRNRGQTYLNTEVLTSILAPFTDYGEPLPKQLCELTMMNNPTSCCRGYNTWNLKESRLDIYSSALDACECPAGHVFDRYETSATQGSARCVPCPDHMNYEAQLAGGRCVCKNGKITDNAQNPFDCSCAQPFPVLRNGVCTNPCGPYRFSTPDGVCYAIPATRNALVDSTCGNPATASGSCCNGQTPEGAFARCSAQEKCVFNANSKITGCSCDASKGLVYDMNYNCVCPENEVFDNTAQRCVCAPGRSRDPVTSLCGPCPTGSVTALEGDCVHVPWPVTNGTCGTQNTRCSQRSQSTVAFRTSVAGVVSTQLSDLSYQRTWLPNIYGHCTPTFRFRYRNFHIKHDVGNADWLQASCIVPEGNVLNEINKQGPSSQQIFMGYCKHAKFMDGSDRGLETKHLCYGRGFRLLRLRIVQDRSLFFQTSDASVDLNVLTSEAEVCECFQGFHGPDCQTACPANCNGACDGVTGQCCSGPRIMPLLSIGIRNDSISAHCANTNFGAVCPFSVLTTAPSTTLAPNSATTTTQSTATTTTTTLAPSTTTATSTTLASSTTTATTTTLAPSSATTTTPSPATTTSTTTLAPSTTTATSTTTLAPSTTTRTTTTTTTTPTTTTTTPTTTTTTTTPTTTTTTPTTTTQPPTTLLATPASTSSSSTLFTTEILVAAGIGAAAFLGACLCVLYLRTVRASPNTQFNAAQRSDYTTIQQA